MDALQTSGLSESECLLVAKNRIGSIHELSEAFGKVNRAVYIRKSLMPYILGMLFFMTFMTMSRLLNNLLYALSNEVGFSQSNLNLLAIGLIAIPLFILSLRYVMHDKRGSLFPKNWISIPSLSVVIIVGYFLTIATTVMNSHAPGIPTSTLVSLFFDFNLQAVVGGLVVLLPALALFYVSRQKRALVMAS